MDHLFSYLNKDTLSVFEQISRRTGKAIGAYDMISEGDRILIAVSGGKDSLTLLNVMLHRQSIAPINFELMAMHVDLGMPGPDLGLLEAYFKSTGVKHHIKRTDLFKTIDGKKHPDLNCFWCSWNRRKLLFKYAQDHGFNKIAFGHHLDDIVETILLNQFFKGELSSMCPKQVIFNGALTLIRPLAHENEQMIRLFAKGAGIGGLGGCRCPVSGHTQRAAIKKIIAEMEKVTPSIKINIFNSLKNIKPEYIPTDMLSTDMAPL
ncbi:MAG: tRNA 2-thiocytidine(32) synthetase TtcA [Candidatus Omnitrophica bacterium]|nr:tRNA 2-thiocytidine(32) synthetase TtcA [Candidatus Omnitrophota bacterium]